MGPAGTDIEHAIMHQWGCFHAAGGIKFEGPSQIKLVYIIAIDFVQWAKALFFVIAAIA